VEQTVLGEVLHTERKHLRITVIRHERHVVLGLNLTLNTFVIPVRRQVHRNRCWLVQLCPHIRFGLEIRIELHTGQLMLIPRPHELIAEVQAAHISHVVPGNIECDLAEAILTDGEIRDKALVHVTQLVYAVRQAVHTTWQDGPNSGVVDLNAGRLDKCIRGRLGQQREQVVLSGLLQTPLCSRRARARINIHKICTRGAVHTR